MAALPPPAVQKKKPIDLKTPADKYNPLPLPKLEVPADKYNPLPPSKFDVPADKDNPLPLPPGKPNKPKPKPNKPGTYETNVTPGNPQNPGDVNVVDYASQLITNPSLGFTLDDPKTKGNNESMKMEDHLSNLAERNAMTKAGEINPNSKAFQLDETRYNIKNNNVDTVKSKDTSTYQAAQTQGQVAAQNMTAAQGVVSAQAQVQAAQVDTKGLATGVNQDGSINYTGKALAKFAAQDFTNIIDTTTAAGKMIANTLGEGNYTDSKATLKGQLEILQSEFVDQSTGEPKIPSWAAATSRNVSKIAAFKGMSGTAATAAMSQALLEASIPIAQADSQFFQTLTLQNLDNRQQSVINTANVLAKMEQTNVDNRMAAAIQNSKSFLEMDMANLSNEQQSRVINNQNRVQSILEDAKAVNAQRLFTASEQNEMDKFYDQLNTQIKQYNSSQNLEAKKFNSTMADSREKFEKEMGYNINIANAKWRQTVQLNEDQQRHEAATIDVKNMTDLSVNQLNKVWDRADSLLDYAWKSSESELNRKAELAKIALAGDMQMNNQMFESLGLLAGTFIGSDFGSGLLKNLFGV